MKKSLLKMKKSLLIKKIGLVFVFFAKRFVALFPKKYDDETVKKIVRSLETKSFYHYKNFFSQSQISELRIKLEKINKKSLKDGKSLTKNLTNKKVRTNVVNMNDEALQAYTQNKLILDVSEKFHGIKCNVTKATYEVKEQGDNPESSQLKDRKDDTIFYHFDRPYKVLKTYLILEDIEDKDAPMQLVSGSHKLMYKSPLKKLFRYISKVFLYDHHYLLAPEDEKFFINNKDVVYCKGNAGDLFFINTEAWHCGRRMSASGKRVILWNYIYGDHLSSWVKQLIFLKFLRK